jgi:hypothetical protein
VNRLRRARRLQWVPDTGIGTMRTPPSLPQLALTRPGPGPVHCSGTATLTFQPRVLRALSFPREAESRYEWETITARTEQAS